MGEIGALLQDLREATSWPAPGWQSQWSDGPVVYNNGRIELQFLETWHTYNSIIPSPHNGNGYGGPHTWSTRAAVPLTLEPPALDHYVFLGMDDPSTHPHIFISYETSPPKYIGWRRGASPAGINLSPYNPSVDKWLSIRHDGTDIYYEVSSDGINWSVLQGVGPIEPAVYPLSTFPALNVGSTYWSISQNRNSGNPDTYILAIAAAVAAAGGCCVEDVAGDAIPAQYVMNMDDDLPYYFWDGKWCRFCCCTRD